MKGTFLLNQLKSSFKNKQFFMRPWIIINDSYPEKCAVALTKAKKSQFMTEKSIKKIFFMPRRIFNTKLSRELLLTLGSFIYDIQHLELEGLRLKLGSKCFKKISNFLKVPNCHMKGSFVNYVIHKKLLFWPQIVTFCHEFSKK